MDSLWLGYTSYSFGLNAIPVMPRKSMQGLISWNGSWTEKSDLFTLVAEEKDMKIKLILIITIVIFQLTGCTLVDYDSTKTESPPAVEVKGQNQSTLESRVMDLEHRVKELEDKLKARW